MSLRNRSVDVYRCIVLGATYVAERVGLCAALFGIAQPRRRAAIFTASGFDMWCAGRALHFYGPEEREAFDLSVAKRVIGGRCSANVEARAVWRVFMETQPPFPAHYSYLNAGILLVYLDALQGSCLPTCCVLYSTIKK